MKCGIKALLITLAIATSGMSAGALAASPRLKRRLHRPKQTQLRRLIRNQKRLMPVKVQRMTVRESASIRHRQKSSRA